MMGQDQGGGREGGKKWADSWKVWKTEPGRISDGSNVGCKMKGGQGGSQGLGL